MLDLRGQIVTKFKLQVQKNMQLDIIMVKIPQKSPLPVYLDTEISYQFIGFVKIIMSQMSVTSNRSYAKHSNGLSEMFWQPKQVLRAPYNTPLL